ncbi:MAG TPA: hypothetical protein VMB27_20500, partial [Solirubrobacteraceae bacterium]|nr:hypothetical protein [Solirubrobacteraceae bacterium]
VLRSQVPSGSTVVVDWPAGEDGAEPPADAEVKLTVIEPAPAPTPVGVGAEGGGGGGGEGDGESAGADEPAGSDDTPERE